jgi:hypothetical protein
VQVLQTTPRLALLKCNRHCSVTAAPRSQRQSKFCQDICVEKWLDLPNDRATHNQCMDVCDLDLCTMVPDGETHFCYPICNYNVACPVDTLDTCGGVSLGSSSTEQAASCKFPRHPADSNMSLDTIVGGPCSSGC